ncbi:MAG: pilus assembly protein [Pelosinus sp.]|nr:pilus assembly protein [Pelosinus sp.]
MLLYISKYMKNHRGQAIVEFALVFPWLVLMLAGIIEFGIAINHYMVLSEAAREGARSAALGANDAAVTAATKAAISPQSIDKNNVTVTINPAARIRGSSVTVIVSYPLKTLTRIMSIFFNTTPEVQGSATMRVE